MPDQNEIQSPSNSNNQMKFLAKKFYYTQLKIRFHPKFNLKTINCAEKKYKYKVHENKNFVQTT